MSRFTTNGKFLIMLGNGLAEKITMVFPLSALKYESNVILICLHLREDSGLYTFLLPLI